MLAQRIEEELTTRKQPWRVGPTWPQLKKQLAKWMLAAEMTHHLETAAEQGNRDNHRNGNGLKTVLTPNGELQRATGRRRSSRNWSAPAAGTRRPSDSMYARGMSVREIQGHLLELYGLQVSPDLIFTVTEEVLA
ncbi:MAG: putative transposase, partial [Paraburkholderia sp.]|nr:putative transposase [Paraburkholderia sp.]